MRYFIKADDNNKVIANYRVNDDDSAEVLKADGTWGPSTAVTVLDLAGLGGDIYPEVDAPIQKHMGPGPHPDGTPQSVHAGNRGGGVAIAPAPSPDVASHVQVIDRDFRPTFYNVLRDYFGEVVSSDYLPQGEHLKINNGAVEKFYYDYGPQMNLWYEGGDMPGDGLVSEENVTAYDHVLASETKATTKPLRVFRGFGSADFFLKGSLTAENVRGLIGKKIGQHFLSTSGDEDTALSFANTELGKDESPVVMQVNVPVGSKGHYLGSADEQEFVWPEGYVKITDAYLIERAGGYNKPALLLKGTLTQDKVTS